MYETLFATRVDRRGDHSYKTELRSEKCRQADLLTYQGAEFDFPTCPAFSRGVMDCARRGLYPFTMQNEAYDAAVTWWMGQMRGWEVDPAWIVPTHGTIYGLATAIRMFVTPRRALLVLPPCYDRYAQAARRMDLPVRQLPLLEMDGTYRLDLQGLEALFASGTVGLLAFCHPNSPTGTVFSRAELEGLDALSRRYRVPVYSDEIFAEVSVDEDRRVIPFGELSGEESLSMTCTSLGKCMSLTGVNHANVMIPNPTLRAAYVKQKYADHYGSIDPMLHAGLLSAYTPEGAAFVRELCGVIRENVRLFETRLPALLPGTRVIHPQGGFVIWTDYTGLGLPDEVLRTFLEEEALLCGDPGEDYGATGQWYRYSLAAPRAELEKSLCFLERVCQGKKKERPKGDTL